MEEGKRKERGHPVRLRLPKWCKHLACLSWMHGKWEGQQDAAPTLQGKWLWNHEEHEFSRIGANGKRLHLVVLEQVAAMQCIMYHPLFIAPDL